MKHWKPEDEFTRDALMFRLAKCRGKVAVTRDNKTRIGILVAWKPDKATGGKRNVATVDFGNDSLISVRLNTYTVVPA